MITSMSFTDHVPGRVKRATERERYVLTVGLARSKRITFHLFVLFLAHKNCINTLYTHTLPRVHTHTMAHT